MPAKILVVDDDKIFLESIRKYLIGQSRSVVTAETGEDALLFAHDSQPDLVLIDADLPGLDGHAVCERLKKRSGALPVIIMSGRRIEEEDVLSGFGQGADDYVLKPFSLPVLNARIEAVLQRYRIPVKKDTLLKTCGIVLDAAGRTVSVGKQPVPLTRKEFDLLATLIEKSGRVLTPQYLLETVWNYDLAHYNDPQTVEVHVYRLRKKLGPKAAKHIVSVQGLGYKFQA